jgi:hypothetical protein
MQTIEAKRNVDDNGVDIVNEGVSTSERMTERMNGMDEKMMRVNKSDGNLDRRDEI